MDTLPPDHHQHHPFADLDGHHESHTDAEEALEAIRVAIGQSTDFDTDPLHDVDALGTSAHVETNTSSLQSQTNNNNDVNHAIDPTLANQTEPEPTPTSFSATRLSTGTFEKGLKAIIDLGFSNEVLLDSIKNQEHVDTVKTIVEDVKTKSDIAKSLLNHVQIYGADYLSNIDPELHAQYVRKSDYDSLKSRLDAALGTASQASGAATQSKPTTTKAKRKARPSVALETPNEGEVRERSSTPLVDEKGRKKRSMKLEHLIHQMANRRLGIEYNVSGFESKGGRELPSPDSTPKSAAESVNGVEEFRPYYKADVNSPTVKPFLDQVVQDVMDAWEAGVGKGESVINDRKVRESVEVYWLRLGKRWEEHVIRLQGGIHKDELVRRKQNQYRRQQSLVARRQASFDQSPLNVCKLRSLYRTLLTIDFAAKTEERPNPLREYTEDEWYAYRKIQDGTGTSDAHEIMDIHWLSPFVRAALCVLDVFSTDQNARLKRKGKPKTPAPGFHLPKDLWDQSSLPVLRPKDEDGLPIPSSQGIVLFRFHVDEQVIQANPVWAQGLYDNPPVPEGDALLPQLNQVMDSSVYQHLRPLVKYTRESANVARLSPDQVREVLGRPADAQTGTTASMVNAFATAHQTTTLESTNLNLDLSLESLVSMTQNSYMASNPLVNQVALAAMQSHDQEGEGSGTGSGPGPGGSGSPSRQSKFWPGSSQQARKMGKRTASQAPGGAVEPVPKRIKGQPYTMQAGQEAPDKDLSEDAGFVYGL